MRTMRWKGESGNNLGFCSPFTSLPRNHRQMFPHLKSHYDDNLACLRVGWGHLLSSLHFQKGKLLTSKSNFLKRKTGIFLKKKKKKSERNMKKRSILQIKKKPGGVDIRRVRDSIYLSKVCNKTRIVDPCYE